MASGRGLSDVRVGPRHAGLRLRPGCGDRSPRAARGSCPNLLPQYCKEGGDGGGRKGEERKLKKRGRGKGRKREPNTAQKKREGAWVSLWLQGTAARGRLHHSPLSRLRPLHIGPEQTFLKIRWVWAAEDYWEGRKESPEPVLALGIRSHELWPEG